MGMWDFVADLGSSVSDWLGSNGSSTAVSAIGAGVDAYSGYQDRKQGKRLAQENLDFLTQRNKAEESRFSTQLALNKRATDREGELTSFQRNRSLSGRQALQDLRNTAKGVAKRKRKTLGSGAGFVGGF